MSLNVIVGKKGSGKSVLAVSFLYKDLLNTNRKIYANFTLKVDDQIRSLAKKIRWLESLCEDDEFRNMSSLSKPDKTYGEVLEDMQNLLKTLMLKRGNVHSRMTDYDLVGNKDLKTIDRMLTNATICLDEAYVYADSRTAMSKENRNISILAMQSRKTNVDFYYVVQDFTMVDVRIRNNVDILYELKAPLRYDWDTGMYVKKGMENEPLDAVLMVVHKPNTYFPPQAMVFVPRKFFGLYDTFEIILRET